MKIYVVDSSSIMRDFTVLSRLNPDSLMIPLKVVDELDKAKTWKDEGAWNARKALKLLEGNEISIVDIEQAEGGDSDATIIRSALQVQGNLKSASVVLLTEDYGMRVRARARGLQSMSAEAALNGSSDEVSWLEFDVPSSVNVALFNDKYVPGKDVADKNILDALPVWTGILLKSERSHALGVWNGEGVLPVRPKTHSVAPKGLEQTLALWALQCPEIPLVNLTGEAGTGKSFLALSAGFDGVQAGTWNKLVIVKNFVEVGKGLGYLPGDLNEKLAPWLDSLNDTIKSIYGEKSLDYWQMMMKRGQVEIVPMSFIRGRTFNNAFVVLDEAQNTSPHEIKTVVTRIGKHSKLALLGDTYQIDSPQFGTHSCGLSHVVRKFRDSKMSMSVKLTASQRSDLAGEAARLL